MDLRVHPHDRPYWDGARQLHCGKITIRDDNGASRKPEMNCSDEPVRIEVEVDHTIYGIGTDDEDCANYTVARRKTRTRCNCPECDPDFSGGDSSAVNVFRCEICNKCFTKCKYFRRHKGLHNKTKTLKCDLCHVSFMFSYQLQSHRLTHTHGQKPFRCNICGKSFTSKYYLKQHEWVHNPVTPFKCRVCGKGYSSEGYFKRHELSHLQ